jgi:ubiquinone/menaquinone biosynthesis C-methylase UbiE
MELSQGMLRITKRKLTSRNLNYLLIHADTNKRYPFPEGFFDVSLNIGGVNAHSDISPVFSEMLRIIKPRELVLVFYEGMSLECAD